jgi:F-type H+-transporting ATPase subunit delta
VPAEVAAKRYAQAAFEIAAQSGDFAAWRSALGRIAAFMSETDPARLLENSRVAFETKHQLVNAALNDLPPLPLNLAHLLVNKGRTSLAPQIGEQFNSLVEERQGIARALVTTAVPLSDVERGSLATRLQQSTGGQVQIQTRVEPAIIGGLIVQIGDKLFDGSTRARLAALKESLEGAVG